jgi:hypothetical protein
VKGSDEAIARLIVALGEDPPPWLVAALGKARSTLASIIRHERAYPGRKELRLRLETLAMAIGFVSREVLNPDIVELLRSGDKVLLYERETYQGLCDLGERVKRLLLDVPQRKGSDKYFRRSEGATPQQNCALMISILWAEVQSKAPPNTNASAQGACAALWAVSGGQVKRERKAAGKWRIPSDSTSTEVWRDHLRKAKKLGESEEAKFLKWSLILGSAETPASPEKWS